MFKYIFLSGIFACSLVLATPVPASQITAAQLHAELKAIKNSSSWLNGIFPALKILGKKTKTFRVHKEDAPLLCGLIENITKRLGMAQPALVFVMKDANQLISNNACATGITHRAGAIFIGTQLIKTLTPEQLEAVIAHELGHLKKYHILKKIGCSAGALGGSAFLWFKWLEPYFKQHLSTAIKADLFARNRDCPAISRSLLYKNITQKLLFTLVPWLFYSAYSRMHEKEADMLAAHAIPDAAALGTALQQIEKNDYDNKWALSRWFHDKLSWVCTPLWLRKVISTHPPTEDRVAYLQE